MKLLRKSVAAGLALLMVFALSACHSKDETALTIDGCQITSALYMYTLMEADSEARTKVDESKSDSTSSDSTSSDSASSTDTTDYYSEKIDGKSFNDWVKNRAIELCQDIALYENLCKENDITLTDEEESNVEYMVNYYWDSYGYSALYEPNGVSKSTFTRAIRNDYLKNAYFKSVYGEGGTDPVAADVVASKTKDTFLLAELLSAGLTDLEDDAKNALVAKFENYEKRLKNGEKFETIYNEHNGIADDTDSSTVSATGSVPNDSSSTDEEEKPEYKYPLGTVMSAADSELSYASDHYATVKKMKDDEIRLEQNDTTISLIIRRDLMSDKAVVDQLNETSLWLLKEDEFEEKMAEKTANQSVNKNNYAIDRFKVKNIVYPSY